VRLDLRKYTGFSKDSAVDSQIDYIMLHDEHDSTIYRWDPLEHMSPALFNFTETLKTMSFASNDDNLIEWTRMTSCLWDYDGNIIYSMRQIGLGKISRADGHIIWQINAKDMPIINGGDTLEWYSPHDFNSLYETDSSVVYSLYATGGLTVPLAKGVIFEMNKLTNKVRLIRYLVPQKKYMGLGQGGCDYNKNGDFILCYGRFVEDTGSMGFRDEIEYGNKDSLFGIFRLPREIYSYKAHRLGDWPRPPRPVIVEKGGYLVAKGHTKDLTWYQLDGQDNTRITKLSNHERIRPERDGIYCVEAAYGMGFVVSRPYTYFHNAPY
jgi:hypothetical protein